MPLEAATVRFWDDGVVPPIELNISEVGVGWSEPVPETAATVTEIIAVCDSVPEVPVIVTPTVIGDAELLAENVNVLVPVELIGPKVPVRPLGNPSGEKLTLLTLNPPVGAMVTVDVALDPWLTVSVLGDAERLKFGAGAVALTVRLTVAVWLSEPEVPVIVIVEVPVAAVLLADNVNVLAVNEAVTPLGRPEAA